MAHFAARFNFCAALLLLLLSPLLVVDAIGRSTPAPACSLSGTWIYLAPDAFDHVSTPAWTNQACLYDFQAVSASHRHSAFPLLRNEMLAYQFSSPESCIQDPWSATQANVSRQVDGSLLFAFDLHSKIDTKVGWAGTGCAFIDMSDGGVYLRSSQPHFALPGHEWIRVAAAWLVRAAHISFADGTRHLTPGYPSAYLGQWLRDSFYGISSLWSLTNSSLQADMAASAEWMFSKARASDGIIPQYCPPVGACQYGQAGGHPSQSGDFEIGCDQSASFCQDLDSSGFATKLAYHVWDKLLLSAADKETFFTAWAGPLELAFNATSTDPNGSGLVWSNTSAPNVGYGFHDSVVKTGVVLYSSILRWNATRLLGQMADAHGDVELSARMAKVSAQISSSATSLLWNSTTGVFMASTGAERDQVDVWGNAFAGASGFATPEQAQAIFDFFKAREADIFFEGQVRQVPKPFQWDVAMGLQLRAGGRAGAPFGAQNAAGGTVVVYQNGGYWATPQHHVLPFLAQYDKAMACRLLNATLASYRSHGINEWIGPFFPAATAGAPGYIASVAGTFFASEHLQCWA